MKFTLLAQLFDGSRMKKRPGRRRQGRVCPWSAEVLEGRQMLSATLWVDPASTHASDFHTIQAAVNAAVAGDTIKVAPGTYTESVTVPTTVTLIGGQIHLAGESGPSIVESDTAGFTLSANSVTIKGFTIEPATSAGDGVATGIATDAMHSGDSFQNNVVEDELDGISLNSPTSGTVQTSTVSGNQFSDNQVAVASTLGLLNANITTNTFTGDVTDSVELNGPSQSNVEILNNQIDNDAQILLVNTADSQVSRNTINDPDGIGINLDGGVTATQVVLNNLTTTLPASTWGIFVISGISTAGNDNNRFANNVVNGFGNGLFLSSPSTGNTLVSNTVENSTNTGIEITSDGNTLTDNTSEYNQLDGIDIFNSGAVNFVGNVANNNGQDGVDLSSSLATITSDTADGNGDSGFEISSGGTVTVKGCTTDTNAQGIFLSATTSVVSSSTSSGNLGDGVVVFGNAITVTGNVANTNGNYGIDVDGNSATVTGNTANSNVADGFFIDATMAKISRNTADSNQGLAFSSGAGFWIEVGAASTVTGNTASTNVGDGFLLQNSTGIIFSNNGANANGGDGIHLVSADGNAVSGNTASNNGNDGIDVDTDSSGNVIRNNIALSNTVDDLFDASSGTGTAGTANTWSHNTATTRSPAGLK